MLKFNVIRNNNGDITHIETALTGYDLLASPKLNKGCAFTREERAIFALDALLPYDVETLDEQVSRMYTQYSEFSNDIAKNIYLNVLHDYNETLFFKLVSQHLEEMLPIIYTPTVGQAVERFSLDLRKPRGLYLSYKDRDQMDRILEHSLPNETDIIVVTDGEAVLGIGDQGIGGIKICQAKMMVYTLCAGMNPHRIFPIQLDVGTNNSRLLTDPMYLGWRHERIRGQAYDDFIDQFVVTTKKKLPHVYLHWEDFGRDNARRILTRYRHQICTLNGDMQSTGVVALACLLAGCIASATPLTEHRIVIFGAGTAGIGIAEQIVAAMQRQGLSQQEAIARLWLLDKQGLLMNNQTGLTSFQMAFSRQQQELQNWHVDDKNAIGLLDVVNHVKPTLLIGCSTIGGAFSEDVVKTMAAQVEKPIIMPLSNPTMKAEAKPEDLVTWTHGNAIIATGSPFPEVEFSGRKIRIAQSNNAYAFPGIGLGAIASKARILSDGMLWAATEALMRSSPVQSDKTASLLPRLAQAVSVSRQVAYAVIKQARDEGLAQIDKKIDLNQLINFISWEPRYYPYRKKERKL